MATISKFYLLDATTPNSGTMPGSGDAFKGEGTSSSNDNNGDATGARTARDATDVAGTSNPDIESVITSNADTLTQRWGHRRFVSRPIAARTFAPGDGNWTFSYARSEANLNHNQSIRCNVYLWRPSTGAAVGTFNVSNSSQAIMGGSEPTVAATEQAESVTGTWALSTAGADGDVLVFEIATVFLQAMATAYTDNFAYNGTTEASTTTCASFVTPPSALTLYVPVTLPKRLIPRIAPVNSAHWR